MEPFVWKWNQAEVLRYLGCKGQPVPENVELLIEECKRELEQCAVPRAVWREFPLELVGDEIRIGTITARSRSHNFPEESGKWSWMSCSANVYF